MDSNDVAGVFYAVYGVTMSGNEVQIGTIFVHDSESAGSGITVLEDTGVGGFNARPGYSSLNDLTRHIMSPVLEDGDWYPPVFRKVIYVLEEGEEAGKDKLW